MFGSVLALGGGVAALVAGFVGSAFGRRSKPAWIRVGAAEDLPSDTFQKVVVTQQKTHAWIEKMVPLTIYVKDLYPKDPVAFLSVCSHLGCSVSWNKDEKNFKCPCHGGTYDEKGEVVSGPPPRPLIRLETKIEDEIFFIRVPDPRGQV